VLPTESPTTAPTTPPTTPPTLYPTTVSTEPLPWERAELTLINRDCAGPNGHPLGAPHHGTHPLPHHGRRLTLNADERLHLSPSPRCGAPRTGADALPLGRTHGAPHHGADSLPKHRTCHHHIPESPRDLTHISDESNLVFRGPRSSPRCCPRSCPPRCPPRHPPSTRRRLVWVLGWPLYCRWSQRRVHCSGAVALPVGVTHGDAHHGAKHIAHDTPELLPHHGRRLVIRLERGLLSRVVTLHRLHQAPTLFPSVSPTELPTTGPTTLPTTVPTLYPTTVRGQDCHFSNSQSSLLAHWSRVAGTDTLPLGVPHGAAYNWPHHSTHHTADPLSHHGARLASKRVHSPPRVSHLVIVTGADALPLSVPHGGTHYGADHTAEHQPHALSHHGKQIRSFAP
jgi:hypothetical protein